MCYAIFASTFQPEARASEQYSTITGRVLVKYNRGNGINQYYLITDQRKLRVRIHILDPKRTEKEEILQNALINNSTVSVTGPLSSDKENSVLEIVTISVAAPD